MADEQQSEEVQRWTAKRRAALVISVLNGEATVAEAARRHGLKVAEVQEWRERFVLGAENALRARRQLPLSRPSRSWDDGGFLVLQFEAPTAAAVESRSRSSC